MRKWIVALFALALIQSFSGSAAAQECTCRGAGDINGDTFVDVSDLAGLVDYAFLGGAPLYSDPGCPLIHVGDINCDGRCNLVDVVILIDMIFNGREAPCDPCGGRNPECLGATCGTFLSCNEPNDCAVPVCATTWSGQGLCVEGATPCLDLPLCEDGNCPPGWVCVVETCCGVPVCIPPEAFCEQLPPGSQRSPQPPVTSDGPTVASPSR